MTFLNGLHFEQVRVGDGIEIASGRRLWFSFLKSEGEIAAPPIRFETNHNSQIYRKQNSNRDGYHYFGNAKVSNAISILPAIIRGLHLLGKLRIPFGVWTLPQPQSEMPLPKRLGSKPGVYLQICQFGNKWKWRLIRSMPSHVGANNRPFDAVLRQVLENLEQALSRWISSGWNEVAGREITDLPQWCDPVDDACFNEGTTRGDQALLTGTTLTIGFKNAPLRLEPTRLRVQHHDSKWIVELHEGQATAPETEGSFVPMPDHAAGKAAPRRRLESTGCTRDDLSGAARVRGEGPLGPDTETE